MWRTAQQGPLVTGFRWSSDSARTARGAGPPGQHLLGGCGLDCGRCAVGGHQRSLPRTAAAPGGWCPDCGCQAHSGRSGSRRTSATHSMEPWCRHRRGAGRRAGLHRAVRVGTRRRGRPGDADRLRGRCPAEPDLHPPPPRQRVPAAARARLQLHRRPDGVARLLFRVAGAEDRDGGGHPSTPFRAIARFRSPCDRLWVSPRVSGLPGGQDGVGAGGDLRAGRLQAGGLCGRRLVPVGAAPSVAVGGTRRSGPGMRPATGPAMLQDRWPFAVPLPHPHKCGTATVRRMTEVGAPPDGTSGDRGRPRSAAAGRISPAGALRAASAPVRGVRPGPCGVVDGPGPGWRPRLRGEERAASAQEPQSAL